MTNATLELPLKLDTPLEAHSLWYKYKTAVWGRESPESATIHNTMRTLRAIRHRGSLAYVSVPITSGIYYYELKLLAPRAPKQELMQTVINYNYHLGWTQVEKITERRRCSVLYPADLVPARQRWQQEDFQALWLSIIAEFCTEVHMCEGWNFSNGGIEELIHTFQLQLGVPTHETMIFFNTKEDEATERDRMRRIAIFDHQGQPITMSEAALAIEVAIAWLKKNGFPTDHLTNCLATLLWTREMIDRKFYQ
ncbi:MAG: hypothetical protein Q8R25_01420 [bacterium]|nr:hypothetical protein [bacterium]